MKTLFVNAFAVGEASEDIEQMSYGCHGCLKQQPGSALDKLLELPDGDLAHQQLVAKKICSDGEALEGLAGAAGWGLGS